MRASRQTVRADARGARSILWPARPKLAEARDAAWGATAAEAWECLVARGLLPASWISSEARAFCKDCATCWGWPREERAERGGCPDCGDTRFQFEPVPLQNRSVAVALASDLEGVLAAEALALEASRRAGVPCRRVAWLGLVDFDSWYPPATPWGTAFEATANQRRSHAWGVAQGRASKACDAEGFRGYMGHGPYIDTAYSYQHAARTCWSGPGSNPWAPLCEIWSLGYGVGHVRGDTMVLATSGTDVRPGIRRGDSR